jgi:N-acetylglucosamine-6-phosphate deacetylase
LNKIRRGIDEISAMPVSLILSDFDLESERNGLAEVASAYLKTKILNIVRRSNGPQLSEDRKCGTIREGAPADFVLLDSNLSLKKVVINGSEADRGTGR